MSFNVGMNFLEYRKKQLIRAVSEFVKDVKENIDITVKDMLKTHPKLLEINIELNYDGGLVIPAGEIDCEAQDSLDRLRKFIYNNSELLLENNFPRKLTFRNDKTTNIY